MNKARNWVRNWVVIGIVCLGMGGVAAREHAAPPEASASKTGKDLKSKIAEMPSKTRKAMSSVVGWSPIYDIEKIPVRAKDIYKITFDHQGHAAEVFIDEFGEVLGDPAVK